MVNDLSILTVKSYGVSPEEDLEITLSATSINAILAQDSIVQNRPVKKTTVLFSVGEPIMLHLNLMDLMQIQKAVGTYGFVEG